MTIIITTILLSIAISTWGRLFVSDCLLRQYYRNQKPTLLSLAYRVYPYRTKVAVMESANDALRGDTDLSFDRSFKALINYDGQFSMADVYFAHGIACVRIGYVLRAKLYFDTGLKHAPNDEKATNIMAEVDKLLKKRGVKL